MKALLIITILLSTINCFSQIEIELAFFDQFQNKIKKIPYEVFDFNDGKIKFSKNFKVITKFPGKIRVFPKGYPFYTGNQNEIVLEIPETKKITDTIVLNEVLSQRALIQSFANSKRKTIYNAQGKRVCDLEKVGGEVVLTEYYDHTSTVKYIKHLNHHIFFKIVKEYYDNQILKKEILEKGNKKITKFYKIDGSLNKYSIKKASSSFIKTYDSKGKLIQKEKVITLTPNFNPSNVEYWLGK